MNNLYGWAMNDYLPYCGFEWLENIDNFEIMSINDKSSIGYFLEVDLECPEELYELQNDFPLAPGKLTVSNDMLSKYCKKIGDEFEIKVGDVKRLIPNLGNKTNYVLHYRTLQLYLSLGMKLTKIHRLLKFKQSDWMKKYIKNEKIYEKMYIDTKSDDKDSTLTFFTRKLTTLLSLNIGVLEERVGVEGEGSLSKWNGGKFIEIS